MHATQTPRALDNSLSETWDYFRATQPEQLEEALLAKAIHASLLDFALTLHRARGDEAPLQHDPHAVLGVTSDASASVIRAAYRKKALQAHPDRGGDPNAFVSLQRAYNACLQRAQAEAQPGDQNQAAGSAGVLAIKDFQGEKQAESIDLELREHRHLVQSWFARDGVNLGHRVSTMQTAIEALNLEAREVGATNRNEQGKLMYNQVVTGVLCSSNKAFRWRPCVC